MLRFCRLLRQETFMSKATRLQLGNVKSPYGELQTAAGSHEKWGYIYKGWRYVTACYMQYRDMLILAEFICYEDLKDRCLTPMPGWARLRTIQAAAPGQFMTFRDPTPLEWLPFELKLGQVKQASY